jgi:prophage tail gpP-like protein
MYEHDVVSVEAVGLGRFENLTSFEITNNMTGPSEAAFEFGDDGTWEPLSRYVAHGTPYVVFVNGIRRLTGRVEMREIPSDATNGMTVRFTVRTKLADAAFASADPTIAVKNTTLQAFVNALYKRMGYKPSDIVWKQDAARDLLTGQSARGIKSPIAIEGMSEDKAKVRSGDTIFDTASRHLRRFGLMHWDSPDGKIVVGAPDDEQAPLYYFRSTRDGAQNNVLSFTHSQDWSDVPSSIQVNGTITKHGSSQLSVSAKKLQEARMAGFIDRPPQKPKKATEVSAATRRQDEEIAKAGFYRPIIMDVGHVQSQAHLERIAAYEMSQRLRAMDSFELSVSGLSYRLGSERIGYAIDTVACVDAGGSSGEAYYVHRVVLRRDPDNGDTANLGLMARGLWKL